MWIKSWADYSSVVKILVYMFTCMWVQMFSRYKPKRGVESCFPFKNVISLHSNIAESKGNNGQPEKVWLWNKFSLSVPKEMYREEYREYGYWCQGVKG